MPKKFTDSEKNQALEYLLDCSCDGKLARGKINEAAAKFQISRHTIWRLVSRLPLKKRSSIRTLAKGIDCKKSTVGRWIKQGLIRAHTSAIRPDLTVSNKLLRLRFTLEALELDMNANMLTFKSMYNTVHKIRSVSRSLLAVDGSVLFDEKIGVFPFTHKVPTKRASKNRSRGTLETKPIESITQEVIRDCLINQSCMLEIMKVKGHNAYKIPHMGKDALSMQAILPLNLEAPPELVRQSIDHLIEAGVGTDIEELKNSLGVDRLEGN
ncbi:hypothetical protein C2S51_010777 [Perilla frutescens var. frutescens]|nr:hypothetical protein C2S51_010777 [Perilla frutescens var. frutescens]